MGLLLTVFLPLALVAIMLSLGLGLRLDDFRRIVTYPKAFAVGLFGQMVMLPVIAFILTLFFDFKPEIAFGFMILSFCPGGPTSNLLSRFAHGDLALAVSLTGVTNLVSVVSVPLLVAVSARHFLGVDAPEVDVTALGLVMFALTTVPVVLGMVLRHFFEAAVVRAERMVNRIAMVLFLCVIIGGVASNWHLIVENLPKLGPSVALLNVILLFAGLGLAKLAGLTRPEATAVSLEAGLQNAALGMTVGTLIAEQAVGLPPFSLPSGVYGVLMYAISIPFAVVRRMRAERLGRG
jgi:bile acid:Na+ symporter, BASS family